MGKKNKKTKKVDTFKKAQAKLNELEASDRVTYLTDKQRTTIVDQILQHHVNERDDQGKALYSEYLEILDAAYEAKDKVVYHQLMQKADQILKSERSIPAITEDQAA